MQNLRGNKRKFSRLKIYRQLNMNKSRLIRVPCKIIFPRCAARFKGVVYQRRRNGERTEQARYELTIFGLACRKSS